MHILFPALLRFSDVGLLLLRLMVAVVFFDSGWNHLKNPVERSKSIGASPRFTVFLGRAEVVGSIGVALGLLTQLDRVLEVVPSAIQEHDGDHEAQERSEERRVGKEWRAWWWRRHE